MTFTWASTCYRGTCPGGFLSCLRGGWGPSGEGKEGKDGHEGDLPMLTGLTLIHICSPQWALVCLAVLQRVPRAVTLRADYFLPSSRSSVSASSPRPRLPVPCEHRANRRASHTRASPLLHLCSVLSLPLLPGDETSELPQDPAPPLRMSDPTPRLHRDIPPVIPPLQSHLIFPLDQSILINIQTSYYFFHL